MSRYFKISCYTIFMLFAIFFGIVDFGFGRQQDFTLGTLKLPNEGCPTIVSYGQTFKVTAEQSGQLWLINGKGDKYPLTNVRWKKTSENRWIADVTLDDHEIDEGCYALGWVSENGHHEDITARSVWIRKKIRDYYSLAHISDVHIRGEQLDDEHSMLFAQVIDRINQMELDFVIITGDLTHNGTTEQFRTFLRLLNRCNKPTFVCAGNHDRAGDTYEQFFYTSTYAFYYSLDGFIVFDTREYRTADSWNEQDTYLYLYRRELKPCRWVIGITHRYEYTMGLRAQLTLFVDDPIDLVIYGHIHRELTEDEELIPWGRTKAIAVPACKDGYFRVYDVGEGGIFPRPVQNVKDKKEGGK